MDQRLSKPAAICGAVIRLMRALSRSRSGNVAIAAALIMPVVVIVGGGGIDLHHAQSARAQLQDVLDAAVLSGARAGDLGAAETAFDAHMTDGSAPVGVERTFSRGTAGSVDGVATASVDTVFLGLIGQSAIAVRVESAAVAATAGRPCIILLDPTRNQSLLVNSGANVTAPNCAIHVHSTANPAAIFNSGAQLISDKICIKGTRVINNGGMPSNAETGCTPTDDPYAATVPQPDASVCTHNHGNYNGGPVSLTPGVYCGWFNFNGSPTVKLSPGLYVIKGGGWNVNGGVWEGKGVSFYFADTSKIQFNSGIDATLSAPEQGPYKDYLFFERKGLSKSQFILNDDRGNNLTGIIYLPSRDVTYNSGSSATGDRLSMVFNSLILNQTRWALAPLPGGSASGGARLIR